LRVHGAFTRLRQRQLVAIRHGLAECYSTGRPHDQAFLDQLIDRVAGWRRGDQLVSTTTCQEHAVRIQPSWGMGGADVPRQSGRYGRPMGPGVPVGGPVTGRLGALDDLPKVVVRSVTSRSVTGHRSSPLACQTLNNAPHIDAVLLRMCLASPATTWGLASGDARQVGAGAWQMVPAARRGGGGPAPLACRMGQPSSASMSG
jgi:hypothetical protein